MKNNNLMLDRLNVIKICYSTGFFESLYPILSDDIVLESQWVFEPCTGRQKVESYFSGKGKTLRLRNCCPQCEIVQLHGYQEGKLCMYMSQSLADKTNGVIVELSLNEQGLISRIDLCAPELYHFSPLENEVLRKRTINEEKE